MEIFEIILLSFESALFIFLIYDNSLFIPSIRYILTALVYFLINILLNYLIIPILLKILILILITVLVLKFFKIASLKESMILCSTFIFCLSICDIITIEICDIMYIFIDFNYGILLLITDMLLTFIVCVVTRRILGKNLANLHIQSAIPLYIVISVDLLFVILIGSIITLIQPEAQYWLFFSTIFVYFLILFNLILLMHFIHCKEIEYNNNINLSKMESDYRYYKGKVDDDLRLQEILHDFKNHLLILKSDVENNKKLEYIANIEKKLFFYDNKYDTGNSYLNIILNEKAKQAQVKDILFDLQITYTDFELFKPEDICSLFGNAIDNAIEACEKIPIKNDRFIKIRISQKGSFMLIVFSNSSITSTSNLKTTKKDTLLHGHGLNNILKCVLKYKGTLKIENKNHCFNLFILIPIKSKII